MTIHRRTALAILFTATAALALSACGGGSDAETGNPPATGAASCTAPAHPLVGKTAALSTRSHLVSGQATIVDNCTIEITNFNYDGLGLSKVFVYGGLGGDYRSGFPIGDNLKGRVFTGQTLRVTMNAGDINKLDGISIWCADVNANFGDAKF